MREPRRWGFSVSRSEYFQVSVINGSKVGGAGSCPQVVFVAVVSQRSTRQMLEPGDMLHGDLIDTHAQPIQELQPQLQARRVRANRGRGPVQRLQMCQKRLHRGHRLAARVKDGPELRPVRHQHPLHPHRDLLPRCVTSTVEGSYDSPDPTKSAPTHRRPSATHPTLADPDEGHGYRERVHNKGVHPEKRRQGHAQTAPEIALYPASGSGGSGSGGHHKSWNSAPSRVTTPSVNCAAKKLTSTPVNFVSSK